MSESRVSSAPKNTVSIRAEDGCLEGGRECESRRFQAVIGSGSSSKELYQVNVKYFEVAEHTECKAAEEREKNRTKKK